tara:strand:- start:46069 stop:46422 length:354 start_codon:yes stop_codon:yes gene_type:complete
MKISEFAKYCGASARSLRHYEKLGLIVPLRNSNGYREYSQSQANTIKQIQWLLKARLGLKKIKYIVPCTLQETKILMCQDLKSLFQNELRRLDKEIEALKKSRHLLDKTLKNSILVE